MAIDIQAFLHEVRAVQATGKATEHSYRPALLALFRSLDPALTVVNEPKQVAVGAPDFVFLRGDVPIGWAEAKDVPVDIAALKGANKEQRDRYVRAFPNLLYTNGLDWQFLRDGKPIATVSIADQLPGLPAHPERFAELAHLLAHFAEQLPISVTSAAQLARLMAAKAVLMKDALGQVLAAGVDPQSPLGAQFLAFKANLLPQLEPGEFADIYAETITYGLFAARLHDPTLDSFSRQEAQELLPKSNPFLRSLFNHIAGPDLDERIAPFVDDLVYVLRASDPALLFHDFGKFTARNDPFIHFYEDFLKEYNPAKRKSRGVWYTPEPVVDFIVRAVDDVLKTEFGLADGLADTSRVMVDWDTGATNPKTGKPLTEKREVHRVQILDPATGTGTFLAKTIQLIAARVKASAAGKWSGYVEEELIPRLHGFELLMASYAMCHMKLDMQLRETGYTPSAKPPRLSVWLTNALEPGSVQQQPSFFSALSDEAHGAGEVKRNQPIMCVIGNPPYSGHSANQSDWLDDLLASYKLEPNTSVRLQERNAKWLNDDYVKFIRLAESLVTRNGNGVVAFITNHGYLDNPTFRGMRWHLLQSFDKIFVYDLHGNAKKREVGPNGSADINVFDIQQGVSLLVAVKLSRSQELATLRHRDIWGTRGAKSEALWAGSINDMDWATIQARAPGYLFKQQDVSSEDAYNRGFSLTELMPVKVLGFQTHRDDFAITFSRKEVVARLAEMGDVSLGTESFRQRWSLADNRDWKLEDQRAKVRHRTDQTEYVTPCLYRPFDVRYCDLSYATMDYPRSEIIQHVLGRENLCLLVPRQLSLLGYHHALLTSSPAESCAVSSKTKEQNQVFSLYLYPSKYELDQNTRRLNFDPALYARICAAAGLTPSPDAGEGDAFRTATGEARPTEVKVFDYIYAVLHAPAYRATYAEFLRIDFPRIPFPRDPASFAALSATGEQLRRLHLMEAAAVGVTAHPFTGAGDDVVAPGHPRFEAAAGATTGRVHINAAQGFDDVPLIAWDFPIGGYRPAQKWLKDRRGRVLSFADIGHYQRIVKVLAETDRLMRGIDLPMPER